VAREARTVWGNYDIPRAYSKAAFIVLTDVNIPFSQPRKFT
jgi:hypothetical protein